MNQVENFGQHQYKSIFEYTSILRWSISWNGKKKKKNFKSSKLDNPKKLINCLIYHRK